MNIWVVGSLNVDLVVDVARMPDPGETVRGRDFNTFLGGKGGNQAMALARLNAHPIMVGRVGKDQFGERYRSAFADAGAATDQIATDPEAPTGTALIEVDETGNNRIVVVAGANGTLTPARARESLRGLAAGDCLLLQLETPMETVEAVAADAARRGATVILDPAPADTLSAELLSSLTWITPNEHEAAVLTGEDTSDDAGLERAAAALIAAGVEHVVIKAGARGALYQHGSRPEMVPGFPVEVVDTTAAGDSFNGGLAWALSRGRSGTAAIRTASAVAALSVTGKGAQAAMPGPEAVEKLLSG